MSSAALSSRVNDILAKYKRDSGIIKPVTVTRSAIDEEIEFDFDSDGEPITRKKSSSPVKSSINGKTKPSPISANNNIAVKSVKSRPQLDDWELEMAAEFGDESNSAPIKQTLSMPKSHTRAISAPAIKKFSSQSPSQVKQQSITSSSNHRSIDLGVDEEIVEFSEEEDEPQNKVKTLPMSQPINKVSSLAKLSPSKISVSEEISYSDDEEFEEEKPPPKSNISQLTQKLASITVSAPVAARPSPPPAVVEDEIEIEEEYEDDTVPVSELKQSNEPAKKLSNETPEDEENYDDDFEETKPTPRTSISETIKPANSAATPIIAPSPVITNIPVRVATPTPSTPLTKPATTAKPITAAAPVVASAVKSIPVAAPAAAIPIKPIPTIAQIAATPVIANKPINNFTTASTMTTSAPLSSTLAPVPAPVAATISSKVTVVNADNDSASDSDFTETDAAHESVPVLSERKRKSHHHRREPHQCCHTAQSTQTEYFIEPSISLQQQSMLPMPTFIYPTNNHHHNNNNNNNNDNQMMNPMHTGMNHLMMSLPPHYGMNYFAPPPSQPMPMAFANPLNSPMPMMPMPPSQAFPHHQPIMFDTFRHHHQQQQQSMPPMFQPRFHAWDNSNNTGSFGNGSFRSSYAPFNTNIGNISRVSAPHSHSNYPSLSNIYPSSSSSFSSSFVDCNSLNSSYSTPNLSDVNSAFRAQLSSLMRELSSYRALLDTALA